MSVKRFDIPSIKLVGELIAPDEIDRYEQYVVAFPSVSATWFGTFPVAGTAATGTLVVINAIADYPRNVEFALVGSAAGLVGTLALYGTNQFGGSINESITFTKADAGGTGVGTKVFAQISAGTLSFGTAVGSGTASVGVGTTGTTTLFGLPCKIAGTTDVKAITRSTTAGAQTVGGGTIAAFVDKTFHAIKAPATLIGSTIISVLYKPTYDGEAEGKMANLSQRT